MFTDCLDPCFYGASYTFRKPLIALCELQDAYTAGRIAGELLQVLEGYQITGEPARLASHGQCKQQRRARDLGAPLGFQLREWYF
jgi:hypothetical protein